MRAVFTKWGGRLHWHFDVVPLGEDAHGRWLGVPAGTVLQRGYEPFGTAGPEHSLNGTVRA